VTLPFQDHTDGGGDTTHPDFEPDHWEGAGKLELQTPFGDRSSLYARSELEFRTYSESEVPDRREIAILVGARSRYFRNVEIDVAGGFGMVAFESNDDLHRFVGEGSLRYRLPNGWTWRVSAANRFVSDLSGNVFVETTGRMGIEKHFGELISASAAAFISSLENDAWDVPKNLFGVLLLEKTKPALTIPGKLLLKCQYAWSRFGVTPPHCQLLGTMPLGISNHPMLLA